VNNLLVSGQKKDIIKRILAFVDPDNETEHVPMGGTAAAKGRKKGEAGRKKVRVLKTDRSLDKYPLSKLTAGMTRMDIDEHYRKEDLRKYCNEKGLKPSGDKNELIRRVKHYLDTGEKEHPPKKRSKKE
jgi:hypothetical protein